MNLVEVIGTDKIDNTIELYYICLLGKYIKNRKDSLSLKGVDVSSFSKTIDNSVYYDFFKYAVENSFITDLDLNLPLFNESDSDLERYLFMGSFDDIKPNFYMVDDNKFYVKMEDNRRLIRESIEESAVIDLTAYLHVSGFYKGERYELHPSVSNTVRGSSLGIASLYYISECSLSSNILKFKVYDTADSSSLGYSTWYFLGKEKGLLKDEGHTLTEKKELLAKDEYQVGNVVFLYERESTAKSRGGNKKLKSCIIAIVKAVNESTITFEKVPFHHTRVSRRKSFESYSRSVQELFKFADFEPVTMIETYSLASLGVDYLMSDRLNDFENFFIAPINDSRDTQMWVEQDGFEFELVMSYADAVFWVLKDWGIKFNEDLYIRTYYKDGEIPLYYQELVDDFGLVY